MKTHNNLKKIQQIVREQSFVEWIPGWSVCYRDVSYTQTKKKIRFKFDLINIARRPAQNEKVKQLTEAIHKEGHSNVKVGVYKFRNGPDQICIWQEFPIEIKEL